MIKIKAYDVKKERCVVKIDPKRIDYCPVCHRNIEPVFLDDYLNGDGLKSSMLQRLYRCPSNQCGSLFFACYDRIWPPPQRSESYIFYIFQSLEPYRYEERTLPELIEDNFPTFCKIYKQTIRADEMGLSEISGMGLRKSLEFLIKKFIIRQLKNSNAKKEEIEKIKKLFLGKCIGNYIEDPKIKRGAERANWLGADETHFYRKWPEKDLEDLKNLMEMTISSINTKLLDEKYQKEMEEPR